MGAVWGKECVREKEITIFNKSQKKKKKTNAYLKRAFRENALQSNKGPSRSLRGVMCVWHYGDSALTKENNNNKENQHPVGVDNKCLWK